MAEKLTMHEYGQNGSPPQDYRTFHTGEPNGSSYPSLPAYSPGPIDQTNESSGCCGGSLPATKADEAELEDYYKIKPPLQVDFHGTFQAPEDTGAIRSLTNFNRCVFTGTKRGLYFFLVFVAGTILSFAFGLVFAILDFALVWMLNPFARVVHMMTRFINMMYQPLARVSLDPVFEAIGQMFAVRNSGPFTERSYRFNVSGIKFGDNPSFESRETV